MRAFVSIVDAWYLYRMWRNVRTSIFALVLTASVGFSASCKRPSPEQCLEICNKYMELHLWEKFEKETASLSEADREERRKEYTAELKAIHDREVDPGLRNCVTGCKRGADREMATCMESATTAADARACNEKYGK